MPPPWWWVVRRRLALVVAALTLATSAAPGSRDRSGAPRPVSPTVVCLTRGRSYTSHKRQLNAAFTNPLREINRNASFAFRPAFQLTHDIVELTAFSPPEVRIADWKSTVRNFNLWQGRRSWGLGVLTSLKICRRGQSMF